jgi:hypothetical protein
MGFLYGERSFMLQGLVSRSKKIYHRMLTFTFFLLLLLIFGCETESEHKGEVIKINPREAEEFVNLSEIADSIKLIKLQTEGDDVIGMARRIIIKKKYIYVQDVIQKVVFVFDKDGKYVSKLNKQGRGPGEYLSLGFISVDDNEEYIEFVDSSLRKILKYTNITFEFLESTPFPDLNFNSMRKQDGFYYCATQQYDNVINDVKTNAGLLIVDEKNQITTLFDKNIETGSLETGYHYYGINLESFTVNDKNELFLSLMFDNTFYRLKAGEAHPVITVDFGKDGIENSFVGSLSTEQQMQYFRDVRNKAFLPVLDINNSDILSISYFYAQGEPKNRALVRKEDYYLYLKQKETSKVYHAKQIRNDLSNFPDRVFISTSLFSNCCHEVWYEDYLVDIAIPDQYFKDPEDKIYVDGVGEITAMDNPVIVMMKLKKFTR